MGIFFGMSDIDRVHVYGKCASVWQGLFPAPRFADNFGNIWAFIIFYSNAASGGNDDHFCVPRAGSDS